MNNQNKNLLDSDDIWATLRNEAPLVTAVIGFSGNGSIVLASDSQMTTHDGRKLSMQKVYKTTFADGFEIIFAIAGSVDGASLFQEIFEARAAITKVTEWRTIPDIAEESMKQARAKILDGFRHPFVVPGEIIDNFKGYFCQVLLAYSFKDIPYIYRLDINSTFAIKCQRDFDAIGTGAGIAGFILSGFKLKELNDMQAAALAVYVVEACKRDDLYCSGVTQMGYLFYAHEEYEPCGIYAQSAIERMQEAAKRVEIEIQKKLGQQIIEQFHSIPRINPTAQQQPSAQSPDVVPWTERRREQGHPSTPPADPASPPQDSSPGKA